MVRTRSGRKTLSKQKKSRRRVIRQTRRPIQAQPSPSSSSATSDEEPSMPVVHNPTQSLSNFIYYQKNGEQINIDVRMGSILHEHCDAIAFTVSESLNLNAALPSKVLSKTGVATTIKKDLKLIKKEKKYLAGDVAAVDLVDSDNGNGWKTLMFVVTPHEPTLTEAYKNILKVSKEKMLSTIAIVGLGCDFAGQMGISPRTSANCFIEALMDFDNELDLDHLKTIAILDVQRDVVKSFISKMNEIVEDMRHLPDNNRKLVIVSNENLLEYEARRLTRRIDTGEAEDTDCVVCLCPLRDDGEEVCALKCDHQFHYECFKQCMTRKCCPVCRKYFSIPCGNQPANATMRVEIIKGFRLDGVDAEDTLSIIYQIPNGIQDSTHLRPGLPYRGTTRYAFLPDNQDGRRILRLLKKAFECRLIFTVGDSVTTGQKNVVTWNSIHHKTSPSGGPSHFGYPDETYFVRVRSELEEAGITEDLLTPEDQEETQYPISTDF